MFPLQLNHDQQQHNLKSEMVFVMSKFWLVPTAYTIRVKVKLWWQMDVRIYKCLNNEIELQLMLIVQCPVIVN